LFRALADATVTLDLFYSIFDFRHEPSNFTIFLQSVHEIRGSWIELLIANDYFAFVFQPLKFSWILSVKARTVGSNALASSTVKSRGKETEETIVVQNWCVVTSAQARRPQNCPSPLKTHPASQRSQQSNIVGVTRHVSGNRASNRFPE
jgi:hypothetical protein